MAKPHIANAVAATATVWWTQGFAEEEDISFKKIVDDSPGGGHQGLVSSAWARPHEQWGATQLQNRFLRQAKRWMTDRDYTAWMAVRAIGEAATRTQSIDPDVISIYMRGDRFQLAGYKGSTARGTGSCASRFYWPMLAR